LREGGPVVGWWTGSGRIGRRLTLRKDSGLLCWGRVRGPGGLGNYPAPVSPWLASRIGGRIRRARLGFGRPIPLRSKDLGPIVEAGPASPNTPGPVDVQ